MEMNLICGIIGFIGGGILVHFMNNKITAFDASLHAKVDALLVMLHLMKAPVVTPPAPVVVPPAVTTSGTSTPTAA